MEQAYAAGFPCDDLGSNFESPDEAIKAFANYVDTNGKNQPCEAIQEESC